MKNLLRRSSTARALGLLALAAVAGGWGPHRDITRAAFEALGPDDPLVRFLGDEVKTACELAWLPDWQESLVGKKSGAFQANDYLLFPGMTDHPGHAGKGPREAAEPYFRRALQAVRTETPENAARWIAALVHFHEDAGSPPHAHFVGGELHSRMEHWLEGSKIRIAGYRPKELGKDDASAAAGSERRLEALVDFSRPRGERLEPIAKSGNRAACEPIEMECAEECARTVADVLRTLSEMAFSGGRGGAGLEGRIGSVDVPGLARVPAKVVLLGTSYSTLADDADRYAFRSLPPGTYTVAVLRAGNALGRAEVALSAGRTTAKDFALAPSTVPGNLLRNPDFQLRWLQRDAPDAWSRDEGKWFSEAVPVNPGRSYRLDVDWGAGDSGDVILRWQDTVQRRGEKVKAEPPLARGKDGQVFDVPAGYHFARVMIRTAGDPSAVCVRVALVDAAHAVAGTVAMTTGGPAKPVVLHTPPSSAPKDQVRSGGASVAASRTPDPPVAASGPAAVLTPRAWVPREEELAAAADADLSKGRWDVARDVLEWLSAAAGNPAVRARARERLRELHP